MLQKIVRHELQYGRKAVISTQCPFVPFVNHLLGTTFYRLVQSKTYYTIERVDAISINSSKMFFFTRFHAEYLKQLSGPLLSSFKTPFVLFLVFRIPGRGNLTILVC